MPPRSECPKCGMAFSGHKAYLDGYSDGPPEAEDMLFEYPAWAEQHAEAAAFLRSYYLTTLLP